MERRRLRPPPGRRPPVHRGIGTDAVGWCTPGAHLYELNNAICRQIRIPYAPSHDNPAHRGVFAFQMLLAARLVGSARTATKTSSRPTTAHTTTTNTQDTPMSSSGAPFQLPLSP